MKQLQQRTYSLTLRALMCQCSQVPNKCVIQKRKLMLFIVLVFYIQYYLYLNLRVPNGTFLAAGHISPYSQPSILVLWTWLCNQCHLHCRRLRVLSRMIQSKSTVASRVSQRLGGSVEETLALLDELIQGGYQASF